MPLGNKQIEPLAQLARLKLSPEEASRFQPELEQIVRYFEILRSAEVSGDQSRGRGPEVSAWTRDDKVNGSLPREQALKNAPHTDRASFLVPRVIR